MFYNDDNAVTTVGWEADLLMKAYGFHLAFEYIGDHGIPVSEPTTPSAIPAEVNRSTMVGEIGYVILQRTLGVAVRAEWMDDDDRVDNEGDSLIVSGGIQYYWHRHHVKAQLDFIHREELHGLARDNDTLLFQFQLKL